MPALVNIRCEDSLEVTITSELSDILQGLRMSQGPDTVRSSTEALLYIYHRLGINNLKHDSSWCDEEHYPAPSQPDSPEHLRTALSISAVNNFHCMIHRTSTDLLKMIWEHLNGADFLSFRASSRATKEHATPDGNINWPRLSDTDKIKSMVRMYVDRYAKIVEAEQFAPTRRKNVLCDFCLMSHPKAAFDPAEVRKPAHERQCLGLHRRIPCLSARGSWYHADG
jgi:hypothetical protein